MSLREILHALLPKSAAPRPKWTMIDAFHVDAIHYAIANDFDPSMRYANGETPLMAAMVADTTGHYVRAALEKPGVDPLERDGAGNNAMHYVMECMVSRYLTQSLRDFVSYPLSEEHIDSVDVTPARLLLEAAPQLKTAPMSLGQSVLGNSPTPRDYIDHYIRDLEQCIETDSRAVDRGQYGFVRRDRSRTQISHIRTIFGGVVEVRTHPLVSVRPEQIYAPYLAIATAIQNLLKDEPAPAQAIGWKP